MGPLLALVPRVRHVVSDQHRGLWPAQPGARLLDVGFGDGSFMELCKAAGWEVCGADPDPAAVAGARRKGLTVREGGISAWADAPAAFDAITLSHVIEHVHDPRAVLAQALALLKPGGILWLETPNIDSFGHERFGRCWRGLEPPRHLVIFNWPSLMQLLNDVGFRSCEILPKKGSYHRLSLKSLAIANGKDPYLQKRVTLKELLRAAVVRMRLVLDHKRTEFITLKVKK